METTTQRKVYRARRGCKCRRFIDWLTGRRRDRVYEQMRRVVKYRAASVPR